MNNEKNEKKENVDKKKILLVVGFLILIVVVLFGGAFLYNKFFYKRSYNEVEEIMVTAAKNHFAKNQDDLPANYNDMVSVSVDNLVSVGEMKTLHEYFKDESLSCDGNVIVTNINGKYRYTPSLDCGDSYKTVKFIDYIKENVTIVENGNGLYQMNNELVYRGDNVNNYIKFSGKTYRIVKFSNDTPVIIYTEKLEHKEWDDRYNIEKENSSGINDYSVSRMREYLEKLYDGDTFITKEKKMLVVAHDLEIGKRSKNSTDKTGASEKSAVLENQFIGLLPLYDYLNASLDQNCTASTGPSCVNYNYLARYNLKWWTMTASSENTYEVFYVDKDPSIKKAEASYYVRPVLHLTKESLYVSGNGTKEKPYVIK